MGQTKQCVLEQDEKLMEKVRKYPCLQEKNYATYKDKLGKDNTRAKIDKTLKR